MPRNRSATVDAAADDDDQALRDLRAQPAQLTAEQVASLERDIRRETAPSAAGSVYRRLAFALLMQSGTRLIAGVRKNRELAESVADMVAGIEVTTKRLRSLADLLDASSVRCTVALCVREDAIKLLDDARAYHSLEHVGAVAGVAEGDAP